MRKRRLAAILAALYLCVSALTGCAAETQQLPTQPLPTETQTAAPSAETTESGETLAGVAHAGQVPPMLEDVIATNAFYGATVYGDRMLKMETLARDDQSRSVTYQVRMIDRYGKELGVYTCDTSTSYLISTLTATSDGGFLFVLGFQDSYIANAGGWASEKGFASRVIKCDSTGNVQFDAAFDGTGGSALEYCLEKDGKFYIFGTKETPETKTVGVCSPTDVFMVILDHNGNQLKSGIIAGSDYDSLTAVELTETGFLLSICAQSEDGDFAGSNSDGYGVHWSFVINDDLEITGKEITEANWGTSSPLGELKGMPVYSDSPLLDDFDGGKPTAVMDYGDFYLIVSSNRTGLDKNMPFYAGSTWYCWETVYSGYDHEGNLLFRTSVNNASGS